MKNLKMAQMMQNQQKKVENKPNFVLVGLWNPQPKYINTRHNIGADILFSYCQKKGKEFQLDSSGSFQSTKYEFEDKLVNILITMTSMNKSGQGLKAFLMSTGIKDYELVVIHDDIDLAFGRFRIKKASSDGGHNGIKSMDSSLGHSNYWRFKIGLGRPPSTVDPADYVLSKFNNDETEEVEFIIEDSMEIIDSFLENSENGIKKASERRIIDVI